MFRAIGYNAGNIKTLRQKYMTRIRFGPSVKNEGVWDIEIKMC